MKKLVILISILVMMCALVACGKNEEKKQEELYDAEKAVSYDKKTCDTIKACFNAAITNDEAYKQAIGYLNNCDIYIFDGNRMESENNYSEIIKELSVSLIDLEGPVERGKSRYHISWTFEKIEYEFYEDSYMISNIKVETVE